jgi:hypothetical protein
MIYQNTYNETISTWKIERVVRHFKLYPNPARQDKISIKRSSNRSKSKKRIQQLAKKSTLWFLLQLDGIIINCNGLKR